MANHFKRSIHRLSLRSTDRRGLKYAHIVAILFDRLHFHRKHAAFHNDYFFDYFLLLNVHGPFSDGACFREGNLLSGGLFIISCEANCTQLSSPADCGG